VVLFDVLTFLGFDRCPISKDSMTHGPKIDVNLLVMTLDSMTPWSHDSSTLCIAAVKQLTYFKEYSLYLKKTQTVSIIWHYEGVLLCPK